MKILLTGSTGGIGSAIKEALEGHELITPNRTDDIATQWFDWLIFAQGTINEEDYMDTFNVNTFSCIKTTQQLLSRLRKGVIYISSAAAIGGNSLLPIYSASKAALNIYSKSMAKKHRRLKFISICPGPTRTEMWKKLHVKGVPQEPEVVAKAVLKAIKGRYKNAHTIVVRAGKEMIWN